MADGEIEGIGATEAGQVNTYLSDLFFNYDQSEAERHADGKFDGYDMAALKENARQFLSCLDGLGVPDLPTPELLTANFLHRV